jgi:hypothetical protein
MSAAVRALGNPWMSSLVRPVWNDSIDASNSKNEEATRQHRAFASRVASALAGTDASLGPVTKRLEEMFVGLVGGNIASARELSVERETQAQKQQEAVLVDDNRRTIYGDLRPLFENASLTPTSSQVRTTWILLKELYSCFPYTRLAFDATAQLDAWIRMHKFHRPFVTVCIFQRENGCIPLLRVCTQIDAMAIMHAGRSAKVRF